MYSSGLMMLPLVLDIFAPSLMISPCARKRTNGSSKERCPRSCSTIVMNREYRRCSTACSLPPVYEFTGSHFFVSAAFGTRHAVPLRVASQRGRAGVVRAEILDVREHDRQVALGHRDYAAFRAVDNGDRRAPVALARDGPVVQAIVLDALGGALCCEPIYDAALRVFDAQAVELTRVHQTLVVDHLGDW